MRPAGTDFERLVDRSRSERLGVDGVGFLAVDGAGAYLPAVAVDVMDVVLLSLGADGDELGWVAEIELKKKETREFIRPPPSDRDGSSASGRRFDERVAQSDPERGPSSPGAVYRIESRWERSGSGARPLSSSFAWTRKIPHMPLSVRRNSFISRNR